MSKTEYNKSSWQIGVLSDTHGLLRPEVLQAFQDVDLILHAGDIGGPDILAMLQDVAPVLAVRGNMDYGSWLDGIPATRDIKLGQKRLFLIHDPGHIAFDPGTENFHAVINGHTHQSRMKKQNGVLLLNPGSAGYRRKNYPVSISILKIDGEHIEAELIGLG